MAATLQQMSCAGYIITLKPKRQTLPGCAGHGAQAPDTSGEEADGKNETICPLGPPPPPLLSWVPYPPQPNSSADSWLCDVHRIIVCKYQPRVSICSLKSKEGVTSDSACLKHVKCCCCADFEEHGQIVDDELNR